MAYEVTATRRRPQKFEDLVGQDFVAETIRNSIQSGKIAHAYLFSGPRGCGKTSTARILAKALNCVNGPTATPCGVCPHCQEITKGSCTDVIEIDGASNTGVNDVRAIKDEVLFPPQSCNYKIYIIDEVHMLSNSAFNALLKTIEEPPPKVIFIFATTELHKVPATIKSRCQQFNFRLVPIEKVKQLLADACAEIGIEAEDEALYWIARESTGSIRDAYTLFDQVAAFSGNKITYDKIRDKLGLVGVDRLNALFEDCAQNKTHDALEKLDGFLEGGISIEQLIANSTDYMRSLLLIKNGITKEALLGQAAERFSSVVLQTWNPVQIERGISLLLQLYRDIRYSLNPRYELEVAVSRLSWLSKYVSPAEVKAAIESARQLLEGGNSNGSVNSSSNNSAYIGGISSSNNSAYTGGISSSSSSAYSGGGSNGSVNSSSTERAYTGSANENQISSSTDRAYTGGATSSNNSAYTGASSNTSVNSSSTDRVYTGAGANQAPSKPMFTFSALRKAGESQAGTTPSQSDGGPSQASTDSSQAEWASSRAGADSSYQEQSVPPDVMPSDYNSEPMGSTPPAPDTSPDNYGGTPSPFVSGGVQPPEQKDLRAQATSAIMTENAPLAATLMRAENWREVNGEITAEVDSRFTQAQIQAQGSKINELISRALGRQVSFKTVLHVQQQMNPEKEAPEVVKVLCNTFKGSIINVAPHVDYGDDNSTPQNPSSENEDGAMDTQLTGDDYESL